MLGRIVIRGRIRLGFSSVGRMLSTTTTTTTTTTTMVEEKISIGSPTSRTSIIDRCLYPLEHYACPKCYGRRVTYRKKRLPVKRGRETKSNAITTSIVRSSALNSVHHTTTGQPTSTENIHYRILSELCVVCRGHGIVPLHWFRTEENKDEEEGDRVSASTLSSSSSSSSLTESERSSSFGTTETSTLSSSSLSVESVPPKRYRSFFSCLPLQDSLCRNVTSDNFIIGISGAGIAGLAVAIALLQRGFRNIHIYEKDRSFFERNQGYGLTMQQGSLALGMLGINDSAFHGISSIAHYSFTQNGTLLGCYGRSLYGKERRQLFGGKVEGNASTSMVANSGSSSSSLSSLSSSSSSLSSLSSLSSSSSSSGLGDLSIDLRGNDGSKGTLSSFRTEQYSTKVEASTITISSSSSVPDSFPIVENGSYDRSQSLASSHSSSLVSTGNTSSIDTVSSSIDTVSSGVPRVSSFPSSVDLSIHEPVVSLSPDHRSSISVIYPSVNISSAISSSTSSSSASSSSSSTTSSSSASRHPGAAVPVSTGIAVRHKERHNIHLPRQALRKALIDYLNNNYSQVIHWGTTIESYERERKEGKNNTVIPSLTLRLSSGTNQAVNLLIGADGIHSKLRQQKLKDPLRYLGVIVILGFTAIHHPLTSRRIFQTSDGCTRLYTMPFSGAHTEYLTEYSQLDGKEYEEIVEYSKRILADTKESTQDYTMWQLSFPVTEEEAIELAKNGSVVLKEEALRRCSSWHNPIPVLLKSTEEGCITGYPAYDRDIVEKERFRQGVKDGTDGNTGDNPDELITLIGDAAHPMSPFKGQGANQALLDALLLAKTLNDSVIGWPRRISRRHGAEGVGNGEEEDESTAVVPLDPVHVLHTSPLSLPDALKRFESEMLDRVRDKVYESRANVKILHSETVLMEGNCVRSHAGEDEYMERIKNSALNEEEFRKAKVDAERMVQFVP